MAWLIGKKSRKSGKLSLQNKVLLYKCISKPIWTYSIQLWGAASKSIIKKIETLQSKMLRSIANAPWYVRKSVIQRDLNVPQVREESNIAADTCPGSKITKTL